MSIQAESINNKLFQMADRESKSWFVGQTRNLFASYYFWYLPSKPETWGDLSLAEDAPGPDWKLADTQRISRAWTMEQVRRYMIDNSRRLPILPF